MPTLLFPPPLSRYLWFVQVVFVLFQNIFPEIGIWGLKETSESFNSQSKYFNFWARNVIWKYWFGFHHHQSSFEIKFSQKYQWQNNMSLTMSSRGTPPSISAKILFSEKYHFLLIQLQISKSKIGSQRTGPEVWTT